ncbi:MAG TPA: nucleotidyltransferase domain-containing protein [Candidatus Paenibacillus intestinavium]|nr:nucleotidyltransferase domain-containing protein [Candidatus Paenibacillus intestinavium]
MAEIDIRGKVNEIALQFAESLQGHIQIRSLYVYGSSVNGGFTEDSDIDIAVVADGFSGDVVEDRLMLMKMRRSIDYRIEPHPFMTNEFNESDPMAQEVIRTGIKII